MFEGFIQFLSEKVSLEPEDREFIPQVLSVKHLNKGEHLLQEGEVSQAFYFNQSGWVRLYYNVNGEERTAWFYPENSFISAYESFVRQQPSRLNLQATEATQVIEIGFEAAQKLLQYSPRFEALARIGMEEELISHQHMVENLLTLNPEERYFQLLERNPEIFRRVPQHYIASFIGVKPESLSRIKKRFWDKT